MKKDARVLLATLALIVAGTLALSALPETRAKPNIILISIDSLRPDHMGIYGYSRETTPYIDAWAKNSVVLDNYFAAAYLTPISETSVHTGKYPFTNGVINFESGLSSGTRTLAEILQNNGWQTAAFGSSPEFSRERPALFRNFSRGFDVYEFEKNDANIAWYGRGNSPVPDAIAWMNKTGGSGDKPFFVWLVIGSAHWPYGQDEPVHFSDPEYDGFFNVPAKAFESTLAALFNGRYGRVYNGAMYDNGKIIKNDASADLKYIVDRYDDGLVSTDRSLKNLFEFLNMPQMHNTIVILQSEHGEDLGDRGTVAHYDISDVTVHAPLIIQMPGLPAHRSSTLVSGVDLAPTLLSALNLDSEAAGMDGKSFYPFLSSSEGVSRTEVFLARTPLWERVIAPPEPWLAPFVAEDNIEHFYDTGIRTDDWKLIHRLARDAIAQYSWYGRLTGVPVVLPEYQLYDLKNDPEERNDVYDTRKNDNVVSALRDKLNAWEKKMNESLPSYSPPEQIQPYF